MNATLLDFEKKLSLGPVAAAGVLCIAYPTYAQYRSGLRPFPEYREAHVWAILRLSESNLAQYLEKYSK